MDYNRIEAEVNAWQQREARLGKLFSFAPSANRVMMREKLRQYEHLLAKYGGTKNHDERFTLAVIAQERARIEKQLYPNLFVRLLRRVIIVPLATKNIAAGEMRQSENNSRTLQEQLQRTGFPDLYENVREKIRQGNSQFAVSVSYYTNDRERIDHELSFARDKNGEYRFEGFLSNLHDEKKRGEDRQHFFSNDGSNIFDARQAYNLLSGRSVQNGEKWQQLDLNDKDAKGNFRIKEFHDNYGFDIEKVLGQLPLGKVEDHEANRLKNALKDGNRQSVTFIRDGKETQFFIEANPQFRSVNIYDEHSKKITLNEALGNQASNAMNVVHKTNEQIDKTQTKRNGKKIG